MCGRYNLTDSPAVHELLHALDIDIGPLPTRYNVAPTEPTATIIGGEKPVITDMRWWFTPAWSDGPSQTFSMFNAKSETVSTSRAFRGAFTYRRGIVPVSSFIEWRRYQGQKIPYLVTNEQECLFLAAIWELWNNELYSCAIVTTSACEAFRPIHHRQPVILSKQEALDWVQNGQDKIILEALMQPRDLSNVLCTSIASAIGNARDKSAPQLIAPAQRLADLTLDLGFQIP